MKKIELNSWEEAVKFFSSQNYFEMEITELIVHQATLKDLQQSMEGQGGEIQKAFIHTVLKLIEEAMKKRGIVVFETSAKEISKVLDELKEDVEKSFAENIAFAERISKLSNAELQKEVNEAIDNLPESKHLLTLLSAELISRD